jgi:hypothetical protein
MNQYDKNVYLHVNVGDLLEKNSSIEYLLFIQKKLSEFLNTASYQKEEMVEKLISVKLC